MADEEEPRPKKARVEENYELYYWPGIPGRGEPIRLAFEETGTTYEDVAYTRGVDAVTALFRPKEGSDSGDAFPHFAPPILKHGDLTISQLPNIMHYLGPKLGLAPEDEGERARVNQLFLTIADAQNEAHDVHHPISGALYYEDQKDAALERAKDFRETRIPKFFKHFESVLTWNAKSLGKEKEKEGYLLGENLTYADLMLFHLVDGLKYAFPIALKKVEESGDYARVFALHEQVKTRPRISAYLKSKRRQPYGMGLYRQYKELDDE